MEKKLYLCRIGGYDDIVSEVEIVKETEKRYTLGSNKAYRDILNKSELNVNIESGTGFRMFSESREQLIEMAENYIFKEIERANFKIAKLQTAFKRIQGEK